MLTLTKNRHLIFIVGKLLALSWFYALCSQIVIPLPFNLVPLSLQPLPLFVCTFFFGREAVNAYGLYLLQGALGLPFFSHFGSGLVHLCGPTGGYIFGWGLAMLLISVCKQFCTASLSRLVFLLCILGSIYFSCGLLQLSLLIPVDKILTCGLYPFVIGDTIKLAVVGIIARHLGK